MMHLPTPPPVARDLMDLPNLAAYLGKSKSTIYRLMAKEGLPARRIGSRWCFSRTEVDAWVVSQPGINVPKAG